MAYCSRKIYSRYISHDFAYSYFDCHYKCESRVEDKGDESGSNAAKKVKEEAREGANRRSRLDIGQTIEPVEKALNELANGTDKGRKRITRNQRVVFIFLAGSNQVQ